MKTIPVLSESVNDVKKLAADIAADENFQDLIVKRIRQMDELRSIIDLPKLALLIQSVKRSTPADEQGGYEPGDIILEVDGKPVGAVEEIDAAFAAAASDVVKVKSWNHRNGQIISWDATRPDGESFGVTSGRPVFAPDK